MYLLPGGQHFFLDILTHTVIDFVVTIFKNSFIIHFPIYKLIILNKFQTKTLNNFFENLR
jgi:hypothetical protein